MAHFYKYQYECHARDEQTGILCTYYGPEDFILVKIARSMEQKPFLDERIMRRLVIRTKN